VDSNFTDILGLAVSIRELSNASRRMRTSLWSSLQATILFAQDPQIAAGETLPNDDSARFGPKPETKETRLENTSSGENEK
jgi:hypothetical protein